MYKTIGIMSGTSLDGLDIAYVEFWQEHKQWRFRLGPYTTLNYASEWRDRLATLPQADALTFAETHTAFGRFCGEIVADFIDTHKLKVDIVASHGHTVFHQPNKGFTTQIGDGATMAVASKQRIICDFRTTDVAKGGQGAPLVPIGDALLFSQYMACINIGGFANISFTQNKKRIAFDICPANIVLNAWAKRLGQNFDQNGNLAQQGKLIPSLLTALNALEFYQQTAPKSLGKEWVEHYIEPLLEPFEHKPQDILHTFSEHIAMQIAQALPTKRTKNISIGGRFQTCRPHIIEKDMNNILISGGGAYNHFLMKRIRHHSQANIVETESAIIDMKEAIIFAFLGLLRHLEQTNILASVTGAQTDSISGAVYLP